MATGTPERETAPASAPSSGEFLAKTRVRRSNAGARMATLINEEADDELALLFAEQEDDEEFEFDEDAVRRAAAEEDEEMGEGNYRETREEGDEEMSDDEDDDEDQGPNAEGQDYEGEKELQRQAREEKRAQKRKAKEGLGFATLRKKVRIDQSAQKQGVRTPTIPVARPRKKSERTSWLPRLEDGPTRSSSRKQTMENKEATHARLKESAVKREATLKMMQMAAEKKAKQPQKVLTQEDRLREAAKTERLNAKSLNRWEEMEKRRAEEQQEKLLALQNRRLEGPVVTWWSGIAKWVNDKLVQVGYKTFGQASEEVRKRKPKEDKSKGDKPAQTDESGKQTEIAQTEVPPESRRESAEMQGTTVEELPKDTPHTLTTSMPQAPSTLTSAPSVPEAMSTQTPQPAPQSALQPVSQPGPQPALQSTSQPAPPSELQPAPPTEPQLAPRQGTPKPEEGLGSFLDGIQLYASMNESPRQAPPVAPSNRTTIPPSIQAGRDQTIAPQPTSQPLNSIPIPNAIPLQPQHPLVQDISNNQSQLPPPSQSSVPAPPPRIEFTSRTSIILQDFEDLTPSERGEYNIFYNPRKAPRLQSKSPSCPVHLQYSLTQYRTTH